MLAAQWAPTTQRLSLRCRPVSDPAVEPGNRVDDAASSASMFGEFARTAATRAPLYARMSAGIAADPGLAALLLAAPPTQRQPVLLFAAVHELLLAAEADGRAEPLARHYPNLTADPDTGDPLPALRELCARRGDELGAMLRTRRTQTNEIGRCALVLPAFGIVAAEVGPLAHLDVGTSAGLNLLLARYQYRYEPGGEVGPPSTVLLSCGTRGTVPVPGALPPIAVARGIDSTPVALDDDAQARWLEACVWPDQTDRFERLRAAIEIARAEPPDVCVGDAVADVAANVRQLAAEGHPVVTNTWVLNYLTPRERRAYVAELDTVGAELDLSWTYLESPFLTPELPGPAGNAAVDRTVLVLVRWRSGRRTVEHLADTHPHGYWMHWTR